MGWIRNVRKLVVLVAILTMTCTLAGCGTTAAIEWDDDIDSEEEKGDKEESDDAGISDNAGISDDAEISDNAGTSDDEEKSGSAETDSDINIPTLTVSGGTREKISDEEAASLQYMEKVMLENYYGDKTEYEMYAPIGSYKLNGTLSYFEHGLMFSAAVYNYETDDAYEDGLRRYLSILKKDYQTSEIMRNDDDRYVFLSSQGEDYNGLAYDIKGVLYQDVRENGIAIEWDLEVMEDGVDSETYLIIDEISKCYGIYLDDLEINGEWEKAEAERLMEMQDVYEPEEGKSELTKADGYQYMGITAISVDDIECPIMLPMGRNSSVLEESAMTTMHGVYVYIWGYSSTHPLNYQADAEAAADRNYRYVSDPDKDYQNARRSEVMAMSGFNQAVYYVIEYDEPDYNGEEYHSRVDVYCYIKLSDKSNLRCELILRSEDYDDSTNILLKELETAYGIDLSRYYYEKED